MAEEAFASLLAIALVFMLYVLANFYFEAKHPRRRLRRYHKDVIVFRYKPQGAPESPVRQAGSATGGVEAAKSELSPVVLPIGVRRLAAKRAARS